MKRVIVLIDAQHDFYRGALGTKEAEISIEPTCRALNFLTSDPEITTGLITTKDCHDVNYLDTHEGKMLPIPHTINGTAGFEYPFEIREAIDLVKSRGIPVKEIIKSTFGVNPENDDWQNMSVLVQGYPEQIIIFGLCTDICVISNALQIRAKYSEADIIVLEDCCAGVTPEKHKAALTVMESCQIRVLNSSSMI